MGTTVQIDDALLAQAREITGTVETEAIVREGLRASIARENARAMIALGGSYRDAWIPEWRRPAAER